MAHSAEDIQKGAALFFLLLKNSVVSYRNSIAEEYLLNQDMREILTTIAREAGMIVLETRENLHMVSSENGSIFANSYTQMKEKYKDLENKRYFYLANIIICVFLSEVDKENMVRIRWEEQGISYVRLEELVTSTINSWKIRQEKDEIFSKEWGIAVDEIFQLWNTEFSHSKVSQATNKIEVVRTTGNRLSFINTALKPLADQGLIIDDYKEYRIIPRSALYERLDKLYHNQERYRDLISLIEESKGAI